MGAFLKIVGALVLSVAFVAFMFHAIGPEWHGQSQGKRWMVGWANSAITRHLGLAYTPEFVDAEVEEQLSDNRWSVVGIMVRREVSGAKVEQPYRVIIEQLCGAVVERRCWRLVGVEVDAKPLKLDAGKEIAAAQSSPVRLSTASGNPAEPVLALGGGANTAAQREDAAAGLGDAGKLGDAIEESFAVKDDAGGQVLVRAAFEVRRRGEVAQAINLFSQALDSGGLNREERAAVLFSRGGAHLMRGAFRRAINDFNGAIDLAPKLDAAYFDRGRAYERSGQVALAKQDFRKALELNPDVDAYRSKLRNLQ